MSFRSVFALLGVVWVSACSSNESGGTVGTGAASSFGGGYGGNLPMGGIGGRAANGGAVASGGTSVAGASGSNAVGFGGWSPGTGGLMASGAGGLVAGGGGSSTAGAGGSASGTGGSGVGGTGGASSVGGSAGAGGNDAQCPSPSEPANQSTCTGVVAGTYCTYGSDSCLCKHKNYMGAWTCLPANASCESVAPGDSTACTGKVGADCLYPNVECVCGVDELWHCTVEQNPACPPGPTYPSGDCTGKEGLSCNYGYIDCFCGGSHTWFCLA